VLTSFRLKNKLFNNCGDHKCLLLTLRVIILKIVVYFTLLDQHPTLSKLTKSHMKNQHTNVCYGNPSSKYNLETQKNHDVSFVCFEISKHKRCESQTTPRG
jgi:hypothetical protein